MFDSTYPPKALGTRRAGTGDVVTEMFAATPLAIFIAALKSSRLSTRR